MTFILWFHIIFVNSFKSSGCRRTGCIRQGRVRWIKGYKKGEIHIYVCVALSSHYTITPPEQARPCGSGGVYFFIS
ncbi:MAG TPA: hypothetical protein DEP23_15895, partial [Ruminococcaceae bacterium]|nr:hypothetical protein [Oscillospiraceae bacterium]